MNYIPITAAISLTLYSGYSYYDAQRRNQELMSNMPTPWEPSDVAVSWTQRSVKARTDKENAITLGLFALSLFSISLLIYL